MAPTFSAPLLALDSPAATLENAGGKGYNLARLSRAGFPVPGGFLLPTTVYQAFVIANRLGPVIEAALDQLEPDDPAALDRAAQTIQAAFVAGTLAADLVPALADGYAAIGASPVAVRSSATAEDLPGMSFAGQQDTYLNVQGVEALCAAVVRCWASLWNARAIAYRARNAVPQNQVALAVVVQAMVQAEASGVLFTANPLTGRRVETAIDATLGLGEALVSGQVEPDHYVVDLTTGSIVQKTLGPKAITITSQPGGGTVTSARQAANIQAIPDAVILELTAYGQAIAALYGFPQDIEWAWAGGKLYLVQSRPITSLFPLPDGMAMQPLRVMMAFAAVQGMFEPITPLGQDTLIIVLTGAGKLLHFDLTLDHQSLLFVAAERLYINATGLVRVPVVRNIAPVIAGAIDPGVAEAYRELVKDPRFIPTSSRLSAGEVQRAAGFVLPMLRRIVTVWRNPDAERVHVEQLTAAKLAETAAALRPAGDLWLDYEQLLEVLLAAHDLFPDLVIPYGAFLVVAGMIPFFGILQRFASQVAKTTGQPELAQLPLEIARSLPYNVTTEMDLALWQTAVTLRQDPAVAQLMQTTAADALAEAYLKGSLPSEAQQPITKFMQRYGMRGLGEIDMGRPRWREQPEHIMQVLQSYLAITDPEQAPDVVFQRGIATAEAAIARLAAAVRRTPGGWLKARLVHWAARRYRAVGGMREAPKFFAIQMLSMLRQGLLECGAALVAAGMLEQPDDLFFLHVGELREIGQRRTVPNQLRTAIAQRRAERTQEMRRRQQPRVMLSDGTAYYGGVRATEHAPHAIVGDPVSPGTVEGIVHVVLDPIGVRLAPGEILVCPGTDPAWTPLFLAAGGLVMEVGGMMTHGSVVAREYGIPAVVGVTQATTRLQTGQRIRVDGSSGVITPLD